jgi:hypothetical protein
VLVGDAEQAGLPAGVEAGDERRPPLDDLVEVVLPAVEDLHADDPVQQVAIEGEVAEAEGLTARVVEAEETVRAPTDRRRRGGTLAPVVPACHPEPGRRRRLDELPQRPDRVAREREPLLLREGQEVLDRTEPARGQRIGPPFAEPHVHVPERGARPLEPADRGERPGIVGAVGELRRASPGRLVQPGDDWQSEDPMHGW